MLNRRRPTGPRARQWSRAGAVCAAAALVTLAAACGGSSGSSAAGGSGSSGSTDSGATLQVATSQPPTNLDPCEGTGGADLPFLNPVYSPLIFSVPSTGALEPGLASSWAFSANKLALNVTLKQGLTFQDGTPVNAAAAVASLQRCLALKVQSVPTIKDVVATGADTFRIDLTAPTSGLPGLLSNRLGMIVSPAAVKKYGSNFADHPVGAGPYSFVSYIPDSSVTLAKFAGYKPAGEPAAGAAGMHIQIIEDQTALASAVISGSAQYAFAVDPSVVATLEKASGISVHINNKSLAFTDLAFNESLKPLNNVDVRLAIEYAINRTALATGASNGVHNTAAWAPYPPGNPYYDAAMNNAWPYSVAKAKQLLAEAGYPNGVTLTGVAIAAPPFQNDGIILQQQLAEAGIKVQFQNEQPVQAIDSFSTKDSAMMFSIGYDAEPTAYATYYGLFSTTSFDNAGHVPSPAMDTAISSMNTTYNDSDLMTAIKQADQALKAEAPIAPLYYNPFPEAYTSKIQGADQASSLIGEPDLNYLSLAS
ncbi:MAG TPA: ABC transporter substrate-binding protein [Trebonia sp.]